MTTSRYALFDVAAESVIWRILICKWHDPFIRDMPHSCRRIFIHVCFEYSERLLVCTKFFNKDGKEMCSDWLLVDVCVAWGSVSSFVGGVWVLLLGECEFFCWGSLSSFVWGVWVLLWGPYLGEQTRNDGQDTTKTLRMIFFLCLGEQTRNNGPDTAKTLRMIDIHVNIYVYIYICKCLGEQTRNYGQDTTKTLRMIDIYRNIYVYIYIYICKCLGEQTRNYGQDTTKTLRLIILYNRDALFSSGFSPPATLSLCAPPER